MPRKPKTSASTRAKIRQSLTKDKKKVKPKRKKVNLGTGMAGKAQKAMQTRKSRLDKAIKDAGG